MLHRRQRDGDARHAAESGRPDADGGHDEVGGDFAAVGSDAANAPALDAKAGHFHAAEERRRAVSRRFARHRLRRARGFGLNVGRDVKRAEYAVGQRRNHRARLVGAYQMRLDAPARAVARPAPQVGETLRRPRDFEASDGLGAGFAVQRQPRPQVDRVPRELRHGFGRVYLIDEPRRVRSGAARLEQRTLIHHDDVPPAELGEMIRQSAPHNPRPDDYDVSAVRKRRVRVCHVFAS